MLHIDKLTLRPYRLITDGGQPDADASESSAAAAILALQRGDERGLETLIALHQGTALRVACAITGDRGAAEDVVADAFIKVYRRIGTFDSTRPFRPWLLRIVVNDAIKTARRGRRFTELLQRMGHEPVPLVDPAVIAEGNQLREVLWRHVLRLPMRERIPITLRYGLDMDERSVAAALDWPLGTLKTRLHRARSRLRRWIVDDAQHNRET